MSVEETRNLTEDKALQVSDTFENACFSITHNQVHATFLDQPIFSYSGDFPWFYSSTHEEVTPQDFDRAFPHFNRLQRRDQYGLSGRYHNKKVSWHHGKKCWIYQNNHEVTFSDTEEESVHEKESVHEDLPEASSPPPESGSSSSSSKSKSPSPPADPWPPSPQPRTPSESSDQAEVSQLLESATSKVAALITQVSCPQTPQIVPGGLPVTPATPAAPVPSTSLPTPLATVFHSLPPVVPPVRVVTPPPRRPTAPPIPPRTKTPLPQIPMSSAKNTSSPKLLGAPPEAFDGKPEKAEAFWNNLENYYYLNSNSFPDEGKKVSSALTHFKLGTSAGEWAQDVQKEALSKSSIDFGKWTDFRDKFKKHFIPAHSKLEATNAMYSSKMGTRPFNEWYQDWSTYASRSGANEETQMFAFRKALPQALHQKIMGVFPQPTTLEGLAEKAREFDRLWRMYTNPAFTRSSGPRTRALATDEDHTQVNATTSMASRPLLGGKISKEEKDRRYKEKLCFYCGKPNHTAKECRVKKSTLSQGPRNGHPRNPRQGADFRARATVTQEESNEEVYDEEHPAQVSSMYQVPRPRFDIPRPHSAPVNEDF